MDVKEAIEKRRAYRSLDNIEITNELIDELARSAQIAPSCFNKQPWKYIFISDKDQLESVFSTLTPTNKWVKKASMLIAVISNVNEDCIIGEREYYLFDTGMATAHIILRATEMGLVAHPIAGFKDKIAKEILHIPNEMILITMIVLGKHSAEVNPELSEPMKLGEKSRPPRKELNEFAFLDEYNKPIK